MRKQYASRDYWRGMLNASVCKLLILRAVCDRPGHGYAIIRRVADLTQGVCVPTEGTVYPVLREFEDCGCLTVHDDAVHGRTRRVYRATPQGRAALHAGLAVWRHGLTKMNRALAQVGGSGICSYGTQGLPPNFSADRACHSSQAYLQRRGRKTI